jgi:hypothetical protein
MERGPLQKVLIELLGQKYPDGVPTALENRITEIISDNIEEDNWETTGWLAAGINDLYLRKRTDWTKIECLISDFQNIVSLLLELGGESETLGLDVTDDGITVCVQLAGDSLVLLINMDSLKYRIDQRKW